MTVVSAKRKFLLYSNYKCAKLGVKHVTISTTSVSNYKQINYEGLLESS